MKKNLYLTLHKIEEKQQKKKKDTLQKLDGMFSDNKKFSKQNLLKVAVLHTDITRILKLVTVTLSLKAKVEG